MLRSPEATTSQWCSRELVPTPFKWLLQVPQNGNPPALDDEESTIHSVSIQPKAGLRWDQRGAQSKVPPWTWTLLYILHPSHLLPPSCGPDLLSCSFLRSLFSQWLERNLYKDFREYLLCDPSFLGLVSQFSVVLAVLNLFPQLRKNATSLWGFIILWCLQGTGKCPEGES